MTQINFRLLIAMLCLWLAVLAAPVAGQSMLGLGAKPAAETPDVAKVIEQAAQNGVSVIVIDSEGNLVSPVTPPSAAPEEGDISDAAGLMEAQKTVAAFRAALFEQLANLPVAVNEVLYILRATSPDGTIFAYFKVLVLSLMLFAIGMVAEGAIYGKRIARHFVVPLIKENPQGYAGKMPFLIIRFIGGVIGILFSMMVAYIVGYIVFGPIEDPSIQYTATLINIGYFLARFVVGLWRMILSPFLTQYRIPRLTDAEAKRLFYWLSAVVSAAAFVALFGTWIRALGLNEDVYIFLAILLSLFMTLLNIVMILVNRRAITLAILDRRDAQDVTLPMRTMARLWVPFTILFFIYAWGERTYQLIVGIDAGLPLAPAAYLILTIGLVVYGLINFGIERSFARAHALRAMNAAEEQGEPMPEDAPRPRRRMESFEDLSRRIAGILAFVAGGYAFLNLSAADADMLGDTLLDRLLDVLVIIFIGYILYHAFRIWIDGKIAEEAGDEEEGELGDEGGGSSASRLATLLPLFRNVILIVIVIAVGLIVLMEMGINVGPLFAGAGIVGVAVGFGSQTLVRDIFSGAFFLFDDAFRKGEYIEIGDVRGTVEKISVRSFQLRHHLGKLHTIPFGEIQVLTNYSRDWVMMKLPLRVTYDTDVERVRKLIKKLGQRLLEDPVIGQDFIQPLKSQGVIEMQDSAMIIRVKFMTKPGDQWVIRKRVFQEIRDLFEREGIKFAHREVTVRLADEPAQPLSPGQKEAVLAAAEASIEEDMMDGPEKGDDR